MLVSENENTKILCHSHQLPVAKVYAEDWRNYSSMWNNSLQFQTYLCRSADLFLFREKCASIDAHSYLIFGLVGVLSSIFSLIIFNRREFRDCLGFLIYRIVAYLELGHMLVMILLGLKYFFDCDKIDFWCQFLSAHFGAFLSNTCAEGVDFLILFLCIERIVACLFPYYFKRMHRKNIFLAIILLSISTPLLLNLPMIFQLNIEYSWKMKNYRRELSRFGKSSLFRLFSEINAIRLYVVSALITLFALVSVCGLWKARRRQRTLSRKRKLQGSAKNKQASLYEHVLEMCILQLCLAVPAVVNYALLATMKVTSVERVYFIGLEAFWLRLPYDEAMSEIDGLRKYHILRSAVLVTNFFAHALHFYLYLLFCANVRKSFSNYFKEWKVEFRGWFERRLRSDGSRRELITINVN